jgi:predicted transposase YbfD/YdcC
MDYSTLAANLDCDADGILFDVHSLYACFLGLTDRRHRQGRRYALALILVAIVLAKLSGEDKPTGIADWARARKELFIEAFGLSRPAMPGHNTYRRALGEAVWLNELEERIGRFLKPLPGVGLATQLTLDGKTVRGTIAFGETRGLHLLAAYLPGAGIVLFQVEVDPWTSEIGAAPQVLKRLDLHGKIVTGDALLAQRELSLIIGQAGGDYVWTVKDNQPRLRQDIETLFAPDETLIPGFNTGPTDFRAARRVNSGHGRIEIRAIVTSSALKETSDWPYLEQVFKLERETHLVARGTFRREVVYGLTSLSADAAPPERLLELVRSHWGIENGLHYRRDVTLKEDAGRSRHWALAHAMAVINNLVLALLLRGGQNNAPKVRRHYAAHPDEALKLLLNRLA